MQPYFPDGYFVCHVCLSITSFGGFSIWFICIGFSSFLGFWLFFIFHDADRTVWYDDKAFRHKFYAVYFAFIIWQ